MAANEIIFKDAKLSYENGEFVKTDIPQDPDVIRTGLPYDEKLVEVLKPIIAQENPVDLNRFMDGIRPYSNFSKGYGGYAITYFNVCDVCKVSFVMQTPQGKNLENPYISVG